MSDSRHRFPPHTHLVLVCFITVLPPFFPTRRIRLVRSLILSGFFVFFVLFCSLLCCQGREFLYIGCRRSFVYWFPFEQVHTTIPFGALVTCCWLHFVFCCWLVQSFRAAVVLACCAFCFHILLCPFVPSQPLQFAVCASRLSSIETKKGTRIVMCVQKKSY